MPCGCQSPACVILFEIVEEETYGSESLLEFLVFEDGGVDGGMGGTGVGIGVGAAGGGLGLPSGWRSAGGQDGVFARVPDQQAPRCMRGGFDEVVLPRLLVPGLIEKNIPIAMCPSPAEQDMTDPIIMHPRLHRHPAPPHRIRIPRHPKRNREADRTRLGKLQPQIIVHARDRVVVLVDHEMVSVRVVVPLVQLPEVRDR